MHCDIMSLTAQKILMIIFVTRSFVNLAAALRWLYTINRSAAQDTKAVIE